MSLINWKKRNGMFPNVSSVLDNFFDESANLFESWRNGSSIPSVNVKDDEKNYSLEVAAPGLSKKDFNIEVDKGVLTISSETKKEDKEETDNYTRREYSYSSFSRSFWLPEEVKENDIKATYKDGILSVNVPKVKVVKKKTAKKIAIK